MHRDTYGPGVLRKITSSHCERTPRYRWNGGPLRCLLSNNNPIVALSDKLNVSMQFLTRGTDEVSPEVAFPKETLYYIPEAAGFNERRYKRLLKLFRNMTEAIKEDHEDG